MARRASKSIAAVATERDAFEAWLLSQNHVGGPPAVEIVRRMPGGQYALAPVQNFWMGWQARAAITKRLN